MSTSKEVLAGQAQLGVVSTATGWLGREQLLGSPGQMGLVHMASPLGPGFPIFQKKSGLFCEFG